MPNPMKLIVTINAEFVKSSITVPLLSLRKYKILDSRAPEVRESGPAWDPLSK